MRKRNCTLIFFAVIISLFQPLIAIVPRVVIGVYDKKTERDIYFSKVHQLCEMPLNHLGYIVDYYDVRSELPELSDRDDVEGVVVWFDRFTDLTLQESELYISWAIKCLDAGKKFVHLGKNIFGELEKEGNQEKINEFWNKLGLEDSFTWIGDTYNVTLKINDPYMVNFERKYPLVLPGYKQLVANSKNVQSQLVAVKNNGVETCLVMTSEKGGFAAEFYANYYLYDQGKDFRQWYINPFLFFEQIFSAENFPKPDTTTLAGRRIYYSHIDGDGWNNISEIQLKKDKKTLSSEVILEKIILQNPDLPVTVAPIAADISLDWVGNEESLELVNKIFKIPYVEMSSHTFSHPFDWKFFEHYTPSKERPFLYLYPNGSWLGKGFIAQVKTFFNGDEDTIEEEEVPLDDHTDVYNQAYDVPRAFALKPFDLDLEVRGALEVVNNFGPSDQKAVLYQWSGDCRPFYNALLAVKEAGISEINGGDSRFDAKFPSYSWVRPLGRQVGDLRQVYASNSNENTYTDLWRTNFYAFNILPQTFENTETPLRVKPMNLYYHMYSGEKVPGLNALIQNIEYVKTKEFIPIKTSEFAKIVQGFNSIEFDAIESNQWEVHNRGDLQTIRFDQASDKGVDFNRSSGVIGQRHCQGSLYIYLDQTKQEDVLIGLKDGLLFPKEPQETVYYVIDSHWQIYDVQQDRSKKVTFKSKGFGQGEMAWNVPEDGNYSITTNTNETLLVPSQEQRLTFTLSSSALTPIEVTITKSSQ